MKKEFDFDDIGKKTPYRVPEGFFEEMQRTVQQRTSGSRPAGRRLWPTVCTGIAVAAMLAGLLFVPFRFGQDNAGTPDALSLAVDSRTAALSADNWIREMSDEELEELVSFSESDIFLN